MALTLVDIGLFGIVGLVLAAPLLVKRVEHNLEAFLLAMGCLALTVAGLWRLDLLEEAVTEPLVKGIVPAVLVAGLLFHYGRPRFDSGLRLLLRKVPLRILIFVLVVVLGLLSSVITAIIAALVLVEVVRQLPLASKAKAEVTVAACFAIGLGAALTPVGEPLSTIAIAKLSGAPYHADFAFLARLLGVYIVPGVLAFAALAVWLAGRRAQEGHAQEAVSEGSLRDVFIRALKVFIFVAALILLGAGLGPLVDKYFVAVPAQGVFWLNMSSAALDNATLAAAEIGPSLQLLQIKSALVALLVSGGMLVPGNIPNIISANHLGISSRQWARLGVPIGLVAMAIYFSWLYFVPLGHS